VDVRLLAEAGREGARWAASSRSVLSAAALRLRLGPAHEISVLLCDGAAMRRLNRRWRGKDRATNVLSFPLQELTPRRRPAPSPLGDIAIAPAIARREAQALGLPFEDHFAHLLVHGLLHLLGHDHEEESAARAMEREERRILKDLC
jgi:probable rRNA maturation factor